MQTSGTMTAFANNLRRLLKDRGVTQRELATRVGTSEQRISDLLNRETNTTLETIEAIANALKVDPGDLISRKKPQAA